MIMKSKYDFNVDGDYIDSDDGGVNGDGDGGAPLQADRFTLSIALM